MERTLLSSETLVKGIKRTAVTIALFSGILTTSGDAYAQQSTHDNEVFPTNPPSLFEPKPRTIRSIDRQLPSPIFAPMIPANPEYYVGCMVGNQQWEGIATHYYPGIGCVGCSEGNITAMGTVLNTWDRTLAFMRVELGQRVRITNLLNKLTTDALVNDRGGFEQYDIVADLSPATKRAIEAEDRTPVKIEHILCP